MNIKGWCGVWILALLAIPMATGLKSEELYGFRWSFGGAFALNEKDQTAVTHILSFNSQNPPEHGIDMIIQIESIPGPGQLSKNKIQSEFKCGVVNITVENYTPHTHYQQEDKDDIPGPFTTYIYRCYIKVDTGGWIRYKIINLNQQQEEREVHQQRFQEGYQQIIYQPEYKYVFIDTRADKIELFISSAYLVTPGNQEMNGRYLAIGDWGQIPEHIQIEKGYIPSLQCMLGVAGSYQTTNIAAILFLGMLWAILRRFGL